MLIKKRFSLSMFFRNRSQTSLGQNKLFSLVSLLVAVYGLELTIGSNLRIHQNLVSTQSLQYLTGLILWFFANLVLLIVFQKRCPNAQPLLLPLVSLLSGIGTLTIWRLQPALGLRQNIWLITSIPLALFLTSNNINLSTWLQKYKWWLLIVGGITTILTIFIGIYPSGVGPQLWLHIGGLIFQPSEILKPITIILLAGIFSANTLRITQPKFLFILSVLIIGISFLFFSIQRDFGTAAVLIFLYIFLLYHHTKKKWILYSILPIGIIALLIGYSFVPLIHLRIDTWLHPWDDPSGTSFQVTQSMIAMAAGGLLGTGPGLGSPSLIPLAHSDFIFAAFSEEQGWFGGVLVLMTILGLIWFVSETDTAHKKSFQHLFAVGVGYYLAIQSFLIIAGNIKLLPLTGVTLPLMSYGGSSMLTTLFCLFTVIRFSHENKSVSPTAKWVNVKDLDTPRLLVLLSFLVLAGYQLYWSSFQQKSLLNRQENIRPMIADLYSPRGDILDRNANIITTTTGISSELTRKTFTASFSHIIGYSNIDLGQSGIEYYQNKFLRGENPPNPQQTWNTLLYNQHRSGFDLQLTLDKSLQEEVAKNYEGHIGAAIVLNPVSGEILSLFSSPGFNTEYLPEQIEGLRSDPAAPLLNRATQGQYAPSTILTPLFAAKYLTDHQTFPQLSDSFLVFDRGERYECADKGIIAARWKDALQAGCPSISVLLAEDIHLLPGFLQEIGFMENIPLFLESTPIFEIPQELSAKEFSLGVSDFLVSPFQIAYSYSFLYNENNPPYPFYIKQVLDEGSPVNRHIITQSTKASPNPFSSFAKSEITKTLRIDQTSPFWYALGSNRVGTSRNIWFIGGTVISSDGINPPLLLVLIFEEDDTPLAIRAGLNILNEAYMINK